MAIQKIGNLITLQGGADYQIGTTQQQRSVTANELRILCKTSGGAINILLPKLSEFGTALNNKIYIDDTDDMAGTNNITITVDPEDSIDNGLSYVISENGGKLEIYIASRTEYGTLSKGGTTPIASEVAGGQVYGIYNIPSDPIPPFLFDQLGSRIPFPVLAPSINIGHPNDFDIVVEKSGLYQIDFQVFAVPIID